MEFGLNFFGSPGSSKRSRQVTFFAAVRCDDVKGVKEAVAQGVDVNARDDHGKTAVMWACKKSLAVVKLLKSFGADLEKQSHGHGHGLLSYACKHNRPEVVRWLKTSQSQQRHHLGCSSNFHPGTRAWHKVM
ncbi:hypothetical protein WJX82_000153 [Trebouxia sp. C0006]